jgi:crotonobetainyl-CoA:carnitine CoA-transferase CaiB-like acyl-CoA transferase
MHAAFAVLAALCERDRTGNGHFVESAMIEAALNVAAEMVLEHSANGVALTRTGNRGPVAAPQGFYACRGEENWLALAVADDDQWARLRQVLGDPDWAQAAELDTVAGRQAGHDLLDLHLGEWAARQQLTEVVERLVAQGIPAAAVADGIELHRNPQLRARGYYDPVESSVIGRHLVATIPFRFAGRSEAWVRTAAPTLGQHNREVLGELGLDAERLDALEARGVIGTRPLGV